MKCRIYRDENAPEGWGVEVIVYEDPNVGWTIAVDGDYYIKRDDRWMGVDFAGMLDYVVNELKVVEVGRTIDNHRFREIFAEAKEDRNFARKSGYLPGERRIDG